MCPSSSLSLRSASLVPSLLWWGQGGHLSFPGSAQRFPSSWVGPDSEEAGREELYLGLHRADSPWGPCLAASVWPISWMKSWTSPASSQPSWNLHTHTHTHARAHTHTPLPLQVPDSPTFLYPWCGDLWLSQEHMSAPMASWRCEEDRTLWGLSFGTPNPKGRSAEAAPEAWVGIPALLCFSQ